MSASSRHPPALTLAERMHAFGAGWDRFWFQTGPPHLISVFRIAFGAFLLFYWGLRIPHVAMMYSRETILQPLIEPTTLFATLFAPPPAWAAQIIFAVFFSALVLFTLGARTRVAAIITLLLYWYYWQLSIFQFGTSFDKIFMFVLLVLCCSDCGNTFSVDARLGKGSWTAWTPVSILPQRIIAVQIAATYFGVGWQKLVLPAWQSGEVLAWGFTGRWATPAAWWVARLNLPMWVWDWQVHVVKLFEALIPFALWHRRLRWVAFASGALFHTGVTVFLAIWWFMVLIPAYIVYFSPEEVHAFLSRVTRGRIR